LTFLLAASLAFQASIAKVATSADIFPMFCALEISMMIDSS
jgi:hypothetical protein